jgi:hypothetical protein
VIGHGYYPQQARSDVINRLLKPVSVTVQQDCASSATGSWRPTAEWLQHPAAHAVDQHPMPVLDEMGASLSGSWRLQPVIVGRWGWSAPQQGANWDVAAHFASGQKLGDLILVAEQAVGRGRLVVVGGGSSFSNEGLVRSWQLVGGMMGYLAGRPHSPHQTWRQITTLVIALLLLLLMVGNRSPLAVVVVVFLVFGSLGICQTLNDRAMRVVPDGDWVAAPNHKPGRGNRLAYIDAAHLGPFVWQDWAFDGLNGLALTWMRSDFLPLMLTRVTREHLDQAGVFISIAPRRAYSAAERKILVEFVHRGGILISTVGAEEATGSAALLGDFELAVPASPVPTGGRWHEPEPMGRFRAPYLTTEDAEGRTYSVDVLFYAGWPVQSSSPAGEVLTTDDSGRPIIVCRQVGRGAVVLIGDSYFAANKNLEYIGGEPFVGRYENAAFWRWLISRLVDRQSWTPPKPPPPVATEADRGAESERSDREGED